MAKLFPPTIMTFQGNVVTHTSDISVSWDPALNEVDTAAGRGYSQGPKMMTIETTIQVPAAGPDFNPTTYMDDNESVRVQVYLGAVSLDTEGVFRNASLSWSTAGASAFQVTIECEFVALR